MFLNRKWALELLELLKEYPLRFMTHSDLSIAEDEQLLVALKEAGCYAILAGIESTDPQSLQEGSDFKVRQGRVAARRVTQIQSAGIGVIGSFLLGFDHDTTQSVEEIAQFALETKLFELCVKVITPFPGTAMRERLLAEGREVSEEWGKYTARELVFSGSGLTEAEIQEGLQRIQQRYSSVEAVHERIRHFKELWKQQR
jgi:radical SAM superfamily enzyme YgiQ (UPF0313 family)